MFSILSKKENKQNDLEEQWIDDDYEEGQLSVDVYETPKLIIIKAPIAGANTENLNISINNDMLTIRGERKISNNIKDADYLYKECFWGDFSRSIILPAEVDKKNISADLENGVLTISLKKIKIDKKIKVKIK